jgi:hypothetical protein
MMAELWNGDLTADGKVQDFPQATRLRLDRNASQLRQSGQSERWWLRRKGGECTAAGYFRNE